MHKLNIRVNNFDLLRLLAASQVLIMHGMSHLGVHWMSVGYVLSHFPGVPIFFVISGFLISASYERNPDLLQYARNRLLRIFPALWVCLAISIAIAAVVGGVSFSFEKATPWIVAQATIVQFYNPEFLRGFGVGVLNGSLWSVSVELQFYIALPIIYWFIRGRGAEAKLLVGTVVLAVFNMYFVSVREAAVATHDGSIQLDKLLQVFLLTHLYLFLVGILLQRNYEKLAHLLEGKGALWLTAYSVVTFTTESGDYLNPLVATMLGVAVISLAVTMPSLSSKILRGNDISYGVYIYHMPIINALVDLNVTGSKALLVALLLTYVAALLSWIFVEKQALRLKKNPLHPTATCDLVEAKV